MTTDTRPTDRPTAPTPVAPVADSAAPRGPLASLRSLPPALGWVLLALCVCFALPLIDLVRFSLEGELYSYIALVPLVSVYLFATSRREPPSGKSAATRHRGLAGMLLAVGAVSLAARWWLPAAGMALVRQDALALTILAFVMLVGAACALLLDRATFKPAVFPLGFLLFMAPFPLAMEEGLEHFLQHGSAPAAHFLFHISGMTMHYHDLIFELPGIALRVAPECSGIRSTVVLFMTSLVAGHLFLRSPWSRLALTAFVIPLALMRNGFRIFVLGELCVRIGPHMIDSDIHHRGGPIFFVLSLGPFFALLYFLIRMERRRRAIATRPQPTPS